MSYELSSQGISDFRYVATLDRLANEAQGSGVSTLMDWAVRAQDLLNAIKAETPAFVVDSTYSLPVHYAGAATAAAGEAAIEARRLEIAQLLNELPTAIPTPTAQVTNASLPSGLLWGANGTGTLYIENLSGGPWTMSSYGLQATGGVNRWGLVSEALASDVSTGSTATFPVSLTAPPMTTLSYPAGFSSTTPPAMDSLPLYLGVANGASPVPGGTVSSGIVITRFPDDQPGAAGAWAEPQIEECAGRVPVLVGGYPDGTYGPGIVVTRDQMAVFMQRALDLPLTTYEGHFPDVPENQWAVLPIEALARSGIVGGYADGYHPGDDVTRDQMAVFVARGMAGGDASVPAGPATATFSDVPTSQWAFKYIEYCHSHGIVGGYADGYHPAGNVTRDQMAVFIYRAFLQAQPSMVVLAGPAVTMQNPATSGRCGWAATASASAATPGYAYVSFDAMRLGTALASGGTWPVQFELRNAATPATPATGAYTWTRSLSATDITNAQAAAAVYGNPYWTIASPIPAGLTPGNYVLVVSAGDTNGALRQVTREPAFTINP